MKNTLKQLFIIRTPELFSHVTKYPARACNQSSGCCTTKLEIITPTMFMLIVSPCKKAERGKRIAETYLFVKNSYFVIDQTSYWYFFWNLLGGKNVGGISSFITRWKKSKSRFINSELILCISRVHTLQLNWSLMWIPLIRKQWSLSK